MYKSKDSCLDNAAEDEPIFVLVARDRLAPETVDTWIRFAEEAGVPWEKLQDARRVRGLMYQWQQDHPDQVKEPD